MIVFHRLFLKNFLSIGDNGLTYELDAYPTTLITGKNGGGKSTLIDGLVFGLFGKSYRGVNKAALINTINQRDSITEVEFSSGSDRYVITRGQKPSRLEITKNGETLNESAALKDTQGYIEETILGFDFSSFTKVCILSTTNYVPFTQLSAGERRSFVETMLSLSDFSEMAKVHKTKLSLLKDQFAKVNSQIAVSRIEYESQRKAIDQMEKVSSDIKDSIIAEAKEIGLKAKQTKDAMDESFLTDPKFNGVDDSIDEMNSQKQILTSQNRMFEAELGRLQKNYNFFSQSASCPECKQGIHADHKSEMEKSISAQMTEISASILENSEALKRIAVDIQTALSLQAEFTQKALDYKAQKTAYEALIAAAKDKMKKANEAIPSYDAESMKIALEVAKANLIKLSAELQELEDTKQTYAVVSDLLKDTGIKSSVISKFVPILVLYVNKYLNALGFNVTFDMDTDFSETIRTRYANEHTFDNLSMGERLRISIAITLAWNQIAKIRGKIDTNLVILDEIADSAMDSDGSEDLFELFENVFSEKNIWLISHKTNFHEKVYRHMHLEKKNGFTKVVTDSI